MKDQTLPRRSIKFNHPWIGKYTIVRGSSGERRLHQEFQMTIGCTPSSVPMVCIVFSRASWVIITHFHTHVIYRDFPVRKGPVWDRGPPSNYHPESLGWWPNHHPYQPWTLQSFWPLVTRPIPLATLVTSDQLRPLVGRGHFVISPTKTEHRHF